MRVRSPVLYVLSYAIGALVIVDQLLYQRIDLRLKQPIVVVVAVAALMLLAALTQALTARSAASDRVRARRDEETAAAERARITAEVHATITERIHAIVVEVIAAQQAVVRGAYGDDILTRLNSADESAHAALDSLDRLIADRESTEAAGAPVSVA